MSAEVTITGTGAFAGHTSNLSDYSYAEESTPVIPGDTSGGVGNLSFTVSEDEENSILLYRDEFILRDGFYGAIAGSIDTVSGSEGIVNVSGRSKLARFNTVRTVQAQTTTLGGAFTALLNLVGITSSITIDPSVASRSVTLPGYTGDLWVFVKDLCITQSVEISLLGDEVVVRPLRARSLNVANLVTDSWDISDVNLAQRVEVAYYNYVPRTNFMFYPKGGWTEDVQSYQVGSGETLVVDLPIDGFLTSVQQPTPQLFVARDYSGPNSVYTIAGNDGLPVPVAQWTDNGGSVTLALKDNGSTIEATIVGANIPNLAPFRLAVNSGPSDSYSTLRIIGSGIDFTRETIIQSTGLTINETSNVDAPIIDNLHVSTRDQAVDLATRAASRYGLPGRTYSATARQVTRASDGGTTVVYPTFAAWAATLPLGYLFSGFNSDYAGDTFQDFTDEQFAVVANNLTNQAFGNIGGSRVRYRDAFYRVRSATTTPEQVDFQADADTLFDDMRREWLFTTFAQFNANSGITGLTFMDWNLVPLRRDF